MANILSENAMNMTLQTQQGLAYEIIDDEHH